MSTPRKFFVWDYVRRITWRKRMLNKGWRNRVTVAVSFHLLLSYSSPERTLFANLRQNSEDWSSTANSPNNIEFGDTTSEDNATKIDKLSNSFNVLLINEDTKRWMTGQTEPWGSWYLFSIRLCLFLSLNSKPSSKEQGNMVSIVEVFEVKWVPLML